MHFTAAPGAGTLNREQSRLQNKIDRLLTAYQEELITLEQLRQRMPELRKQEKAVRSELESLHGCNR
jgi:site-specific DNA recombinase